jgi:glycine/D-amino acid oxidase-like deaminating enzyme
MIGWYAATSGAGSQAGTIAPGLEESRMPDHPPIVVVGAGIAGVCCATALRADGHEVLLLDERGPAEGCSYGNAGQFNVGSTLPIALPGMLRKVPGWLIDPLGPLAVRWRYLPRALPWLLRWVREASRERSGRHSLALQALGAPCITLYRQMLGDADAASLLRLSGHLHVWERLEPSAADRLAEAMMAAKGIRPRPLDAPAIRELEPALAPIYQRGLYFPDNGHTVNPQRLVQTLARRFVERGGGMLRARVTGFEIGADGLSAVVTTDRTLPCAGAVIAAGAWSRALARQLGCSVPLEVERGYHAMLPDPGVQLRVPVSNAAHSFVATPMEHGMRLAGTVEIAGMHAPPDYRRSEILVTLARRMFPGLRAEGASHWMGFRPSFPDSLPVIDRVPGVPNAFFSFGHGHYGISLSPMSGRLVADLVARRAPAIDLAPYRITRF